MVSYKGLSGGLYKPLSEEAIETIHEALKEGDYGTIRVIGHGMKGSGGGYGFDAITEMGGIIESAAKNKDVAEIQKQVKDLSTYLESVEIVYDSD